MIKSTVVFLLFLLASACYADTDKLTINIYGKVNGAPKHFANAQGVATGYAFDVGIEALRRAGYEPNAIPVPWSRAQVQSLAGLGIITAFSKTPTREKDYWYTQEMFVEKVILLQNKDYIFPFNSYEDLIDKNIGISRGSNYAGEFSKYRTLLTLSEDDGHRQRLLKLAASRLDAGIFSGDIFLVGYNLERLDMSMDLFHVVEKPISADPNYLGVPKNLKVMDAKDLRDELDVVLGEMKVDGTIKAIRDRYATSGY